MTLLHGPYAKAARVYFDRGWRGALPMPLTSQAKRFPPSGYTGRNGIFPPSSQVDRWVKSRGDYNVSIRLPDGVVGIDVDAYEGKQGGQTLASLIEELGPWTGPNERLVRSTARPDGVSGIYLFKAVPPDGQGWRGELGPGIELVHFGLRYVTAAPSIHPRTGDRYRWLDQDDNTIKLPAPGHLPELAPAWIERASRPLLIGVPPADTSPRYAPADQGSEYGKRALAGELTKLRRTWDDNVEAFNPQLNRSAFALGQLAAGGELDADHARQQIEDLMAELGAPADQWRTLESGFTSGTANPRRAPEPEDEPEEPATAPPASARHRMAAGGLRGTGTFIEAQQKMSGGKKGQIEMHWSRWSDFDIRALGRIVDDDGRITDYSVELTRERDGATFETLLPTRVLAKSQDLTRWLMSYEVHCLLYDLGGPPWNARLGLYLADQEAPIARTSPCLGWDDQAEQFLTYEGAVTADGLEPFGNVRPDPALRNRATRYRYGFEQSPERAITVLRDVLTFHDSTVTSVFGAWWAACLLKGQIMRKVSMFPVMAIEATSESGKTVGFFPMMIALMGNQRGQSNDTAANFRDIVAGHRNGIAWQDDLDDPKRLFELLRAATSEGTIGKKGEDKSSSVDARLVAPILISGEGLDVTKQKALADRVLLLNVPSPRGRRSLHDPGRAQFEDIVELREHYPDLTELAGHLVVAALQQADLIDQLATLRGDLSGRHGDKIAVLRLGARVLAAMTGDPHHVAIVDEWAARVEDVGNENALTLSLVPEYLSLVGAKEEPRRYDRDPHHSVPHPVLIRNDRDGQTAVWVSTELLAQWWKEHRKGRVESRTETAEALRQQASELGMKSRRAGVAEVDYVRRRVYEGDAEAANRNERRDFMRLPDAISQRLLIQFDLHDPDDPQSRLPSVTSISRKVSRDDARRVQAARNRRDNEDRQQV